MRFSFFLLGLISIPLFSLTGCISDVLNVRAKEPYKYELKYGESLILRNGIAIAPRNAPYFVHRIVNAGNKIRGYPYKLGGGHKRVEDDGYDCSGAVSYLLISSGLLDKPMTSKEFKRYGKRGKGNWVSIYTKNGHTFLVVGGLRFDTGYNGDGSGPKWTTNDRPTRGHVIRHPAKL